MGVFPCVRWLAGRLGRIDHAGSVFIRALGRTLIEGLASHALASLGHPHVPPMETQTTRSGEPPVSGGQDAASEGANGCASPNE
jgi:hypothetical protein